LNCIVTNNNIKLVILGDFNIDLSRVNQHRTQEFTQYMGCFGLKQTVMSFTRECGKSKTLIDNIFTDIDPSTMSCRVVKSGLSDHHAQVMHINMFVINKIPEFYYNFKRNINDKNIKKFNDQLRKENWNNLFSSVDADSIANEFMFKICHYFNNAFPIKKVKFQTFHMKDKINLPPELIHMRKEIKELHYTIITGNNSSCNLKSKYKKFKND
jgi:hypothetical protein